MGQLPQRDGRGIFGGWSGVFFARRAPVPGRSQTCRSWLACDAGNAVLWVNRVDIIAGKPAPTEGWPGDFWRLVRGIFCAAGTRTGQITDL